MNRIPYEIIEDFAFELVTRAALSEQHYDFYMSLYLEYLQECGWSDKEFDEAALNHIDESWNFEGNTPIKYLH